MKNISKILEAFFILCILVMSSYSVFAYEAFGQRIQPKIVSINNQMVSFNQLSNVIGSGNNLDVKVDLVNNGMAGCQRIEVGVYNKENADTWYPNPSLSWLSVQNTYNCAGVTQRNVQTKEICGEAGSTNSAIFNLIAPNFQEGVKYTVVAAAYECCFNDAESGKVGKENFACSLNKGDKNYFIQDYTKVQLTNTRPWSGLSTCNNNKKDYQESDIDCGGTECTLRCALGKKCVESSDCASQLCKEGTCQNFPNCADGVKNRDETNIDCGGSWCSACTYTERSSAKVQSDINALASKTSINEAEQKQLKNLLVEKQVAQKQETGSSVSPGSILIDDNSGGVVGVGEAKKAIAVEIENNTIFYAQIVIVAIGLVALGAGIFVNPMFFIVTLFSVIFFILLPYILGM